MQIVRFPPQVMNPSKKILAPSLCCSLMHTLPHVKVIQTTTDGSDWTYNSTSLGGFVFGPVLRSCLSLAFSKSNCSECISFKFNRNTYWWWNNADTLALKYKCKQHCWDSMRYYKLKLGHVQIHSTRFLSYPANKQSEKDLLAEVMTEVNLCFFFINQMTVITNNAKVQVCLIRSRNYPGASGGCYPSSLSHHTACSNRKRWFVVSGSWGVKHVGLLSAFDCRPTHCVTLHSFKRSRLVKPGASCPSWPLACCGHLFCFSPQQ